MITERAAQAARSVLDALAAWAHDGRWSALLALLVVLMIVGLIGDAVLVANRVRWWVSDRRWVRRQRARDRGVML